MRFVLRSLGASAWGLTALLLCGAVGCGKQPGVSSEAARLEQAFAPAASAPPNDPIQSQIQAALAAMKANDHATALTLLDALRKRPGLTAEQRMAVNDAAGQLERTLIQRSMTGDQQAKAALDRMRREMDRR